MNPEEFETIRVNHSMIVLEYYYSYYTHNHEEQYLKKFKRTINVSCFTHVCHIVRKFKLSIYLQINYYGLYEQILELINKFIN